jgi:D-arabinan exo alpha-(1,3)/(1,5)-arabinofuranosidase (non-reducing end)
VIPAHLRTAGACGSLVLALLCPASAAAQLRTDLFTYKAEQHTHWVSPENPTGAKGAGGLENRGAKGHAFQPLKAGQTLTLASIKGAGIVDRMWMTVMNPTAEILRSLKLEIFWDGAPTPAVSVPLGDFFLEGAGEMVPLDTALLASPEGRSFISYIPMPFRKGARIVITNEASTDTLIYFDVDYRSVRSQPADALYFHAWWSRVRATTPGKDFVILPEIAGHGRFLGASFTVQTDPAYGKSWWGEGEVKIALDGDARGRATLVGTGTEDYIGSGWGQGKFVTRYTGSPVADEARGRWAFYRFHVPDPIYFHQNIRVTLQQIGGAPKDTVIALQRKGVRLIPVTVASTNSAYPLLASGKALTDPALPDGWTNFYRSDDVAAVTYFYLDRPDRVLPAIAAGPDRATALRHPASPADGR